jgi:hypothetical protein
MARPDEHGPSKPGVAGSSPAGREPYNRRVARPPTCEPPTAPGRAPAALRGEILAISFAAKFPGEASSTKVIGHQFDSCAARKTARPSTATAGVLQGAERGNLPRQETAFPAPCHLSAFAVASLARIRAGASYRSTL